MAMQKNHQLKPGMELDGRYVIEKVLGEGGFGIAYQGINKRIVIKVMFAKVIYKYCKKVMGIG